MGAEGVDGGGGEEAFGPGAGGEDDGGRGQGVLGFACGVGVGHAGDCLAVGGVVDAVDGRVCVDGDACFACELGHGGCELERVDLGCGGRRAHFIVQPQSVRVDPVEFLGDAGGAQFAQGFFGAFLKADVGVFLLAVAVAAGVVRLGLLADAIDLRAVHCSVAPSFGTAVFFCKFLVQTIAQRDETAGVRP